MSFGKSRREYRSHEPVVRLGGDGEGHLRRVHGWGMPVKEAIARAAYRRCVNDEKRPEREPLPSHASAGVLISGLLAGIEQLITGRPRPVPQIEEPYQDAWASADGVTIEGLDEPIDRPERPDQSGARL